MRPIDALALPLYKAPRNGFFHSERPFPSMSIAYRLFILVVGLSPLFLVDDNLLSHGLLAGYTALLIAIIASTIRPGEAGFVVSLMRPVATIAAVPAAWILVQAAPLPVPSLQHPIWASAQAALPVLGSISISPGATLVALARYFSAFGLFFVAAVVTVDRQRAELVLFVLAGVCALLAVLLIVHDLGGFVFLGEISSVGCRAAITAAATLGTVLTAAAAVYAIERFETRRSRGEFGFIPFVSIISSSLGAFAVCWIAIVLFTSNAAIFAAATGVLTFALIVGFRRLGLGPRLGYVVAIIAVAVPLSLIARDLLGSERDIALRFDMTEAPPSLAAARRIIADTGLLGSGAGTFTALLPIYQDTPDSVALPSAPTTAAALVIELGRPALWIAVIAALAAIVWLIRGALQRGRDSFFPATGASAGVVLLVEAFCDASLLASTTIVIAAALLGLALSQSVSRSSH